MRTRNIEMLEQALSLRDEVAPGDALDAAAGLPAFAAVKHDAGVALGQTIHTA
jgi:hypothetical protein